MDFYKKFEEYRFEGEMYRSAMYSLPNTESLSVIEKQKLKKAYNQGWWLGNLIQFPLVIGAMRLLDKKIGKLPPEKKAAIYIGGIGIYGFVFMLTKSFAWHYSFSQVEPIVKQYIEEANPADIMLLEQDKALGIAAKPDKILIPKKNDKESSKE